MIMVLFIFFYFFYLFWLIIILIYTCFYYHHYSSYVSIHTVLLYYCIVVLWQMPCILMWTVTDFISVKIYGRWINMIWYDTRMIWSSYDDKFCMYVPGLPLYWDILELLHLQHIDCERFLDYSNLQLIVLSLKATLQVLSNVCSQPIATFYMLTGLSHTNAMSHNSGVDALFLLTV